MTHTRLTIARSWYAYCNAAVHMLSSNVLRAPLLLVALSITGVTLSACGDDASSGTAASGLESDGVARAPEGPSGTAVPPPPVAEPRPSPPPPGEPDPGGTSLYSRRYIDFDEMGVGDVPVLEDGVRIDIDVEDRATFANGWLVRIDSPTLASDFRGTITADGAPGERWGVKLLRFTKNAIVDAEPHATMELVPPYDSVTVEDDFASWSATDPQGGQLTGTTDLAAFRTSDRFLLVGCVPLWIPGPAAFAGSHTCTLHISQ